MRKRVPRISTPRLIGSTTRIGPIILPPFHKLTHTTQQITTHVPPTGRLDFRQFVLTSNHISFLDFPLISHTMYK